MQSDEGDPGREADQPDKEGQGTKILSRLSGVGEVSACLSVNLFIRLSVDPCMHCAYGWNRGQGSRTSRH